MSDIVVGIRLKADGSGLVGEIKNAKGQVTGFGNATDAAGDKAQAAGKQVDGFGKRTDKMGKEVRQSTAQVRTLDSAMSGLQSQALGLASIFASGFAIYQLQQLADEATLIKNQLNDVASSNDAYIDSQTRVLALANETRTSFAETARLYATLQRNARQLVETDEDLVAIVGTVNQAFALSGASAAETSGSIRQLSQALASGVLRGEEFNSISEQAPEILKAVQVELGVTKGELRAMAAEGKITAQIVVSALQNAAQGIDIRFQNTARTVEQSMVIARNNLMEFVAEQNEALGITDTYGNAVVALSENIDGLTDTFVLISTLVAGRYVGAMASAAAAKAAVLRQALLATPAVTGLSASMGVQAKSANLATIANNAYALSIRGASAALAFLGGPAGVAFAAAAAVLYFSQTADDAAQSSDTLSGEIDDLVASYLKLNNVGKQLQITKLTQDEQRARESLLAINKQIAEQEERQKNRRAFANAGPASVGNVGLSRNNENELNDLRDQAQSLEQTINEISAKKKALFDSTFNIDDIKDDVAATSSLLKAANDENLVVAIDAYRNQTEALDRELQLQAQVRLGNLTQQEADIYASLYRQEDAQREQYRRLESTIESFYQKEIEKAAENKDLVVALEQEKADKLAEIKNLYREQQSLAEQDFQTQMGEVNQGFWNNMLEHIRSTTQDFETMWGGTFDRFAQGIGEATADAILEQKSFGDAAKAIARSAIREVISGLVQLGVKKLALAAIEKAIGATSSTAAAATAAATGTAMATAYAPAAAFASLASFGGNAVPAMAGIASTVGLAESLSILGQAHDGLDKNAREGTWWLRNDEMVLNPQQRNLFEQMLAANDANVTNNASNQSNSKYVSFHIDARGAAPGMEEKFKQAAREVIAEYDSELQEDFSFNGPRSQLLRAS
ncbi:MAG: hypothetical protein Alis3KO_01030 [Aliiglaciecola sp.]